jgi:hypothetical protein
LLSPDYSVSEVFEFGKLAGERLNTLVQSETTVVQLRKIIHCTSPNSDCHYLEEMARRWAIRSASLDPIRSSDLFGFAPWR